MISLLAEIRNLLFKKALDFFKINYFLNFIQKKSKLRKCYLSLGEKYSETNLSHFGIFQLVKLLNIFQYVFRNSSKVTNS